MKIIYLTISLILLVLLNTTSYGFKNIQSAAVKINAPVVDYGYSTDNYSTMDNVCINPGTMSEDGSNRGFVDFVKYYDQTVIKRQVGLETPNGHVTSAYFSATPGGTFYLGLNSDSYDESIMYYTNIVFKSKDDWLPNRINDSYINQLGLSKWHEGPDAFMKTCGDEYINSVGYGATLYIGIQLHFHSIGDKQKFDGHFSSTFDDLKSMLTGLEQWSDRFGDNGEVNVIAYQKGGDPTALQKILGSSGTNTCEIKDTTHCVQIVSAVMNYISNTFPAQLKPSATGSIPDLAAPISVKILPYNALDPSIKLNSHLTSTIMTDRDNLGSKLDSENQHTLRAKYILSKLTPAEKDYQQQLEKYLQARENSIQQLQQAGNICFNAIGNCVVAADKTLHSLPVDDPSILNHPF